MADTAAPTTNIPVVTPPAAPPPTAPVRVQRSGSLREAPPDRSEIPESSAEDRIAHLLNPKIPRGDAPDRGVDDGEEIITPPRHKESTQVQEEREAAEAERDAEPIKPIEPDPDALPDSLDDAESNQQVEGDDALADTEYTDEATGRKYIVPKALVDGALRQQQFTKVTEEVAAERRYNLSLRQNLETDTAIQAELAPAISQLQQIDQHIAQLNLQLSKPETTIQQYFEIDKQLRSLQSTANEFRGLVTKRSTELSAQKQAVIAALQSAADQLLSKSLPKWNEPVKRAVFQHLTESGFAPEEVSGMYDPRIIRLAHDAALLKRIQSKRQATVKQVQQAAPVVRPQGRPSNVSTENQQVKTLKVQAQRTGKEADAVSAIDRMLKNSRERAARR